MHAVLEKSKGSSECFVQTECVYLRLYVRLISRLSVITQWIGTSYFSSGARVTLDDVRLPFVST
jgi:hypothetical protein